MSKILVPDKPVQFLPKLAKEIGVNEAIFLQQLHYWLTSSSAKEINGRLWVYNTQEEWQEQLSCFSFRTMQRIIKSCKDKGLIEFNTFNKLSYDRTKWYTINYDEIKKIEKKIFPDEENEESKTDKPANLDALNRPTWTPSTGQLGHFPTGQLGHTNTIEYHRVTKHRIPENILSSSDELDGGRDGTHEAEQTQTTDYEHDLISHEKDESISNSRLNDKGIPYQEIVEYLNTRANKRYRATTAKTKRLIKARWNEGNRLDDFKKVIDNKVAEWLHDSKMQQYLRPETLFGTKFEGYLNQQRVEKHERVQGRWLESEEYDEFFGRARSQSASGTN